MLTVSINLPWLGREAECVYAAAQPCVVSHCGWERNTTPLGHSATITPPLIMTAPAVS